MNGFFQKKVLTPFGAVVLAAACVTGGVFLGNAKSGRAVGGKGIPFFGAGL